MGSSQSQSQPLKPEPGLKELVPGNSPVVDIVAIHGLDGNRELSWTAHNSVLWLRDLLPADIPDARIFTYGYNAATSERLQLSKLTIHDHAEQLINKVVQERESDNTSSRPIIFIAHSMGGIVLKFALILANKFNKDHLERNRSFSARTEGILYIGTPHQGTKAAQRLVEIYSIHAKVSQALTKDLVEQSEMLQDQIADYNPISGNYRTKFYYESYATKLANGRTLLLVPRHSAVVPGAVNVEPIALMKDHVDLIRFTDKEDDDYKSIMRAISSMIGEISGGRVT
ncbi:hypothetical protein BU17DRAFT_61881 [Hysterangium stoloniferum]|nr:hypothetical protein BU17DRAFT_61881 [Hysterangium stoloniferum]